MLEVTYQYKGAQPVDQETAQELLQAQQTAILATKRAKASAEYSARLKAENAALKEEIRQLGKAETARRAHENIVLKEQARRLSKADAARRLELGKLEARAEAQAAIIITLRRDKKRLQDRIYDLKKRRPIKPVKASPVTEIFTYSGPLGLAAAVLEASRHNKGKKAA